MKRFLIFFLLIGSLLTAQEFTVTNKIVINNENNFGYMAPEFSGDGSKVFFSGESYKGIYYYDFNTNQNVQLNDFYGAGYNFKVTADGKSVAFRKDDYLNKRRFFTIATQELSSKSVNIISENLRNANPPQLMANDRVIYQHEGRMKGAAIESAEGSIVIEMESASIVKYENGIKTYVKPIGDSRYLWASLSPQGDKILFTHAGDGSYICDLDGKILASLGYANAPKWSGDGKHIICMQDEDDGHQITKSAVAIISADGKFSQTISDENVIALYPAWSKSGNKIAFSDADGNIHVLTLELN